MSIAHETPTVTVEELNEEQSHDLFERACKRELGVTAVEFLTAHESGTYPDGWDERAIQRVEFLLPFAR